MEPMIYKLNLPQMSECILDGVEARYLNHDTKQHTLDDYIYSAPVAEFIKPEYRSLSGFKWTELLIFYKKDSSDQNAHTDNVTSNNTINCEIEWGINWIYKGCGTMEYWCLEDFEKENVLIASSMTLRSSIYICTPTKPARVKYFLTPGAYLVNVSNPHRATGIHHRYCVSYRTDITALSWSNIVKHFDNLIIGEATTVK